MSKFGIVPANLTAEGREIVGAARKRYDEVVAIDPHKLWFAMERNLRKPKIFHDGQDISDLSVLLVRRTTGAPAATALLVSALRMNRCKITDPPARFSIGYASKIKTTMQRYRLGIGSPSYFSFYRAGALTMLDRMYGLGEFPILIKPVDGKRSTGRVVVKTRKRAKRLAGEFFDSRTTPDYPFFVQPFEQIATEYRLIVMNGKCLAIVEKVKQSATARGSEFVKVEQTGQVTKLIGFVEKRVSKKGNLGVDAAYRTDGSMFVIESNRSPSWKRLQEVTGVNIAAQILDNL